jgi:hypothetical protein
VLAGHLVFWPVKLFGERTMGDGTTKIQSWCSPCRLDASTLPEVR